MERNQIRQPAPAGMSPPGHVLKSLRRVDETLDCHYLGDGRWIVGSVRPNRLRRQMAVNKLDGYRQTGVENPQKAQLAVLSLDGFSPIAAYEHDAGQIHSVWGRMVHDVRKRDWIFRHRADEEFEAAMNASSARLHGQNRPTLDEIEDAIHQEYPYLFRGRTHPYVGV